MDSSLLTAGDGISEVKAMAGSRSEVKFRRQKSGFLQAETQVEELVSQD